MVRLRRVGREFAAAESLRRITRGLPAFTSLKSGERGTVVDAGDPSQALVRLRRTLRDFGALRRRGCIGRVAPSVTVADAESVPGEGICLLCSPATLYLTGRGG